MFNPANPQEVAYLRGSRSEVWPDPARLTGLWVGNPATGQQRQVRAGRDMALQVRWGTGGWLALSKDNQVWKVKANGDSLTQLTFGPPHYQPQWSPDGQRLVCAMDGTSTANGHLVVLTKDGQPVPYPALEAGPHGYAQAWAPDGNQLLVGLAENGKPSLGIHNLATGQTRFVVACRPTPRRVGSSCYGAAWLPNSESFVWSSGQGLFRTNAASGATVQLRTGCASRMYLHPSVSGDGRQLIVERTDQKGVEDGTRIYTETNLWLMDLDGQNERKVNF